MFDGDRRAGGMIRSQIPRFRLPEAVIDEEVGYILNMGVTLRLGERVDSLKALLDAVLATRAEPLGIAVKVVAPLRRSRTMIGVQRSASTSEARAIGQYWP